MKWKSIKDFWSEDVPVKEEIKIKLEIPIPPKAELRTCKDCRGKGFIKRLDYSITGKRLEILEDCDVCEGKGEEIIKIFDKRKNSKEEKDDCI